MERYSRLRFLSASACIVTAIFLGLSGPASAIEDNVAAGPIGGTDIRSAFLPPPGFYGGVIGVGSTVHDIKDGSGQTVPGLDAIHLTEMLAGPFFLYVPDVRLFDGSIGL